MEIGIIFSDADEFVHVLLVCARNWNMSQLVIKVRRHCALLPQKKNSDIAARSCRRNHVKKNLFVIPSCHGTDTNVSSVKSNFNCLRNELLPICN